MSVTNGIGRRRLHVAAALLLGVALALPARGQEPPAGAQAALEDRVRAVAAELRCPVCQNLSVADSPSDMAEEMRGLIREQLAAGKTPEEVKAYFLEKYGDWILLSPRARGLGLLVWLGPFAAAGAGLVVAGLAIRRWAGRPRRAPPAVTGALLEQVRREVQEEEPAPADEAALSTPLEAERARLYGALRELDFDHHAGKLSDEDYAEMREAYEARAAAVLAALAAEAAKAAGRPRGKATAARGAAPRSATAREATAQPHRWRRAAGGAFLLAFGVAAGVFLTTSLRPRPDGTASITGDFLTGTGRGGMSAGGGAAMPMGGTAMGGDGAAVGPVMAAVREYRARLEKDPRDLEALLGLAELNIERQDIGQAIEYYKRVLEVDPGHPHALAHFGQILSQGGHLDQALAAFDRALAREPQERFALWNKGWALYEGKRDYAGAIDAWERLLATGLPPDDAKRVEGLVGEARKKMARTPGGRRP